MDQHNWGTLAVVGSYELPGVDVSGFVVYRYNKTKTTWEKRCIVPTPTPSNMLFIPSLNKLYVGSDVPTKGPKLTCYAVHKTNKNLKLFDCSEFTKKDDLYYYYLDSDRSIIYAILENSVIELQINKFGKIGEPLTLNLSQFHPMLINAPQKIEMAFVPLSTISVDSFREIFIIGTHTDFSNKRLFIKFKSAAALALLQTAGSTLVDYYVYVINVRNSKIAVYHNNNGRLLNISRSLSASFIEKSNRKLSCVVSDVVAPPDLPFMYIAKFGHDSIVTYESVYDGLVCGTPHFLPKDQHPKQLYYANKFLYVATCDSIFIFQVDPRTGWLKQVDLITQIPVPTCMVFI